MGILVIICGGRRFGIRAMYGSQLWRFKSKSDAHLPRTLIVGAGETGSLTIKRMLNGDPDMIGDPVAVVDDDPNKQNQRIHDIKVCGTCQDIPAIAHDCEAEQIVVAVPSSTREERQRIYDFCMKTGLRVLTLPNVRDIPQDGEAGLPFVRLKSATCFLVRRSRLILTRWDTLPVSAFWSQAVADRLAPSLCVNFFRLNRPKSCCSYLREHYLRAVSRHHQVRS